MLENVTQEIHFDQSKLVHENLFLFFNHLNVSTVGNKYIAELKEQLCMYNEGLETNRKHSL